MILSDFRMHRARPDRAFVNFRLYFSRWIKPPRGVCSKFCQTRRTAEMIILTVMLSMMSCFRRIDGHAANRIGNRVRMIAICGRVMVFAGIGSVLSHRLSPLPTDQMHLNTVSGSRENFYFPLIPEKEILRDT
jgi:hypothetical protein